MAKSSLNSSNWLNSSYNEVNERGAQDGSILVIPIGSLEQHGDHLPTGTDTILCEAVARETLSRMEDEIPIVMTPPIWSGYSPHHLSFGGTISISFQTLQTLLNDIVGTGIRSGFDSVLLLNGHGGNISLINAAVRTIGEEYSATEILGLTYFELAKSFIDEIREGEIGSMAHGGEFETSLMLYLFPELVDESNINSQNLEKKYELATQDLLVSGPLSTYQEIESQSEIGALGNATLGTSEKGEQIFKRLCSQLENLLRDIYDQNQ